MENNLFERDINQFYDKMAMQNIDYENIPGINDKIYEKLSKEDIEKQNTQYYIESKRREDGVQLPPNNIIKAKTYHYETYEQTINRILSESQVNKIAEEIFKKKNREQRER